MGTAKDLELLIDSRYPLIAVETYEEDRLEQVLQQIATKRAVSLLVWTVTEGLRRPGALNTIYDTLKPLKALNAVAGMPDVGIFFFKDLHRYLGEPEVVRKLHDLAPAFAKNRRALIISATEVTLPPELTKLAAFFTLDLPTDDELKKLATRVIDDLSRQHRVTNELSPEECNRLVETLRGFTLFEAEHAVTKAVLDDWALTRKDLELIVQIKKELLEKEGILEYSPVEANLSEVGDIRNLKQWLAKRQKAFTSEAKQFGVPPPKGILVLGVQGCGKTLVGKAVAKEWGLPLLKLEPGRLYDKFVGESERNLEKALAMADRMAPCVLLIDELEKGFAYVGSSEADAGLSRRIFGRLLSWLQDRKAAVFIVATCNQISQLPPELTRKGRFDEIFFIDLPNHDERKEIFAVHLKRRKRDPASFDLDALADAAEGFSGAEIEQAVVAALYSAFARATDLTEALLVDELKATKPLSVTRGEEITELRQWAQGRTVMAS